ncbi:MAG TPA: hypothetical protein VHE37_11645 [Nevskiaceae bacterium]|nr:hypothetical protein [Nevskiaceae bacterium]
MEADMQTQAPAPAAAKPYDLFAERSIKLLLVLFFGALFYYLADNYVVLSYQPLEQIPLPLFAAAALLGAAAAGWLARKAPLTEHVALSVMCAIVAWLAAQPLLPRINAATASGAQTAGYVQQRDGAWHSAGLPDVRLDRRHANLAAGMTLTSRTLQFHLWRGMLGFYQLDLGALRSDYADANSNWSGAAKP